MKAFLKKRWPYLAGIVAAALALVLFFLFYHKNTISGQPLLIVETPQKLSIATTEEVTLDVTISHLGEALYPAASFSISFDPSRLEFLGIGEGNVCIFDAGTTHNRQLPTWSCNVETSNATGLINILYLDMTGGDHAFGQELLSEEDNVLLRLRFRLRGSVRPGEVLELGVEDAVFAASDETQSLATTTGTLKTKNGRLVIGE